MGAPGAACRGCGALMTWPPIDAGICCRTMVVGSRKSVAWTFCFVPVGAVGCIVFLNATLLIVFSPPSPRGEVA